MKENTSSPEERVAQIMVDGMLKGIDDAGAFLRKELRKEVLEEVKAEYAGRDRALAAVTAALTQARTQAVTVAEYGVISRLDEKVRVAMELWEPRSGRLYEICERCNFDNHICMGCGEELSHLGAELHNAGPGPKCHE